MQIKISQETKKIARAIIIQGGRPIIVGGMVRDAVMGKASKDVDIEVHGMDAETLIGILAQFGKVDTVGASFGVIKLTTETDDFDFSLPRRESKTGNGHKGFMVEVDPTMTMHEAFARRDFTWNGMGWDLTTNTLIDEFDGQADLENGIIRAISEHFADDPLRVLRGAGFAGRFELDKVEQRTVEMCESLAGEFGSLSQDRVWGEWEKLASKSIKPSSGLRFLQKVGWLPLFPELNAMVDVEQNPDWHPEGDVWQHSLQSVDVSVQIAERERMSHQEKVVQFFASLLHDTGKVTTTERTDKIRSRGHDQESAKFAESFLTRIGAPLWVREQVIPLVKEHMFRVHRHQMSPKSVRRLASRLDKASVRQLAFLMEIDASARQPLQQRMPEHAQKMVEIAEQEQCQERAVQPILMGRHLLQHKLMRPGPQMGEFLRAAFQAQLDGEFSDVQGAIVWAKEQA